MKNQQPTKNNSEDKVHFQISFEELDKLREQARASMQAHSWIQYGTEVRCESCPFNHSFYLQPGFILKGIDKEGKPIIDKTLTNN